MSDAEISAVLTPAAPPAPPTTPAEAATRLDQSRADPKWTESFLVGHPERLKEFHDWHALAATGESVDMAMAGMYMEGGNTADHLTQMGTAAVFRELGIQDFITREVLTGTHQVTKAEYRATEIWKRDRMGDPEFIKRYLNGEPEANRKMTLANIILSGGIRDEQAA